MSVQDVRRDWYKKAGVKSSGAPQMEKLFGDTFRANGFERGVKQMGSEIDGRTIFGTYDDFVREVPLAETRSILVHRREHGHREFIRIRTWNQPRLWGAWYPTKRTFVIPIDEAKALADAIYAGIAGEFGEEPEWVSEYEPNSDWFKDAGR